MTITDTEKAVEALKICKQKETGKVSLRISQSTVILVHPSRATEEYAEKYRINHGLKNKTNTNKKTSKIDCSELKNLVRRGFSNDEIAAQLGFKADSIQDAIRRLGIKQK